jgi:2-polyprenyl-3-methyl-5-hydroxy-6-metoxy-1,4-benzoquinol methylase
MTTAHYLCPLCAEPGAALPFYSDAKRSYIRCGSCGLIGVLPSHYLSLQDERAEYDKHQNNPDDDGYRNFLNRLCAPLLQRLAPHSKGLDFGSGPGPVLSLMLAEAGCKMDIYDPHYAANGEVLGGRHRYDFITATEVVEHLRNPLMELERLWVLLKPGGWLGLMTKLALDKEAFSQWHYIHDPTHICFFSKQTMRYLAKKWGTEYILIGADVHLFQKPMER